MSDKFEDILNVSLERLVSRGEELEDVLQAHPQYAERLRPLLLAAAAVSKNLRQEPEAEFRKRASAQFRAAVISAQRSVPKRRFFLSWRFPRAWVSAACVALAVVVAAGTTGFAAAGSMPDQALYPVKLATEQIETVVTPSSLGKAKLEARLAGRRIEELNYMIDKDRPEVAEHLSDRLYGHYYRIENLVQSELEDAAGGDNPARAGPKPKPKKVPRGDGQKVKQLMELRKMLRENNPKQEAVVRKLELRMPNAPEPGVRRALEKSLRGYQQAVSATGDADE